MRCKLVEFHPVGGAVWPEVQRQPVPVHRLTDLALVAIDVAEQRVRRRTVRIDGQGLHALLNRGFPPPPQL